MRVSRVVITGPRQVELLDDEIVEPGPGEVLVRATVSLLSPGTDRVCYEGEFERPSHWASWVRYPFTPGYSTAGVVAAVGEGCVRFTVGDRVVLRRPHRSHVIAAEGSVYPVPDDVPDESACWFALSAIAQHAVREAGQPLGATAAVVGLGALGQLVGRYVTVAGAGVVHAVGDHPARLAAAVSGGALAFPGRLPEAARPLWELTGGADVAYDVTGSPTVFADVTTVVRRAGTVVLVGDTPWPGEQVLGGEVLKRGLSVLGVHDSGIPRGAREDGRRWPFEENVALFFRLLTQHRLDVADLVTHRYPAAEAAQAFAALADPAGLGIVLRWGPDGAQRATTTQGGSE